MRKKAKKFFATMLAGSMIMNLLSFNTLAVQNSSEIQIVESGGKEYYLADPKAGEEAGPDKFDVWTSKTIAGTENEDEFEITLQVGTTMKAVPNDVAVVLVMDCSGSMMKDAEGKKWGNMGALPTDGRKLRIDYAREAALEFAEQLAENSGGAQRMLSIVEFGNNAKTILPWTNANNNGTLAKIVQDAISSVDVNFIIDNRSFWDEKQIEKWENEAFVLWNAAIKAGGESQVVKLDYWSDEKYVHATESNCDVDFESYFKSFMSESTRGVYTDSKATYIATASAPSLIDSSSAPQTICTYNGCNSTENDHMHCTYEDCQSDTTGHMHCLECGVSDDEQGHAHCTYAGCKKTVEHSHCTYTICSNPTGHKHCDRACWCEEDHLHCKDIQNVCGRTDAHTHIRGCTAFFCQDTTPNHKHGCVHGGIRDNVMFKYPFYDYRAGLYNIATARCLNSDPTHTHDLYDGDSWQNMYFDRVHQQYYGCCTNMEGGLLLARNLITTGKAVNGAINGIDDVYVVLLSDGGPTYHVNQDQVKNIDTEVSFLPAAGGGGSYATWEDVKDIVEDSLSEGDEDKAIVNDIKQSAEFYTILYGTELEETLGNGRNDHVLSGVTSKKWFTNTGTNYVNPDALFASTEADKLNTVFAEIKDRIDILAKAWVVTDELGGDELGDDVTFEKFTLNGKYAAVTPASDSKNTTISWSLGNMEPESGSGSVADPYIYTMKYKVTLNSNKENVKSISLAHDADASKSAVWTNNRASLQYFMIKDTELDTMKPEDIKQRIRSAAFAKPSVKGIYGDFEFIKKHGVTKEVIEGAGFTLYDSNDKAYGSEVLSDEDGKVVFTDIPRGEYTLRESTLPEGMQELEEIDLKVSWGQVTKDDGSALEVVENWPIGMETTTAAETTAVETSGVVETTEAVETTTAEETLPTYVHDDDDNDEPETTPQPTTTVSETTVQETSTDVITETVQETKPSLPYVDPSWEPEDIPEEIVNEYYERYRNGDIDLDDIPVGVLGAFFEKGFPMAVLPATSDWGFVWSLISLISAVGLTLTVLFDRKRRDV